MIWRERLIRIEAWFAPACFAFEAPLLVVRPASWWLPAIGGATAVRALVRRRQLWVAQHPAALPAVRAPAFPAGVGCPPGCCPVCGQHDPDRLERCWGHLDAHPSCAEWVGEPPQLAREQWREQIHHFPSRGGHLSTGVTVSDLLLPATMPSRMELEPAEILLRLKPPPCDCGQQMIACPACYRVHCPVCEPRHVFDCGRKWEQQQREIEAPRELPPLHVDPELISYMYGRKWKRGPRV